MHLKIGKNGSNVNHDTIKCDKKAISRNERSDGGHQKKSTGH